MWWVHTRLFVVGDDAFRDSGEKVIPCKVCGKDFLSRVSWGDWNYVYDNRCERCASQQG